MMNRVKTARHRLRKKQGSVVIESALYFIAAAALLTGIVKFGLELTEYYQINSLTDHVGQIIARSKTVSSDSIQTVMDDATSSNVTSLNNAKLCVLVTLNNKMVLSVPSACQCSPSQSVDVTSNITSFVVVNGCSANFQSSSIFPTAATVSDN